MSTERDDLPADLSLGPVRRSHPRHQRVPAAPRPQTGRDWRSFAACRFTDPDLFLPISYSRRGLEQAREAKAICAGCQVWGACLEFAIGTQQVHGIRGGLTEQERRNAVKTGMPGSRVAVRDGCARSQPTAVLRCCLAIR